MAIVVSGSGKIEIGTYHIDVNGKSVIDELRKALEIQPDDYKGIVGRIKIIVEPYPIRELESISFEEASNV